jgi:erythromycin esterase
LRGIRRCALLVAACASLAPAPYGDAPVTAFQAWARTAEIPLTTTEWLPNDSDLAPFAEIVGGARVVALGEPGHGAHQPLEFRNRLFGYLVTHCGFTAIGLETSFTEARAIDDFVMGGRGDAATLARRDLTWGFGGYEENVQLIIWMRSYNEHAGRNRKLHFYGIDMSGANDDADFTHPEIAVRSVVQYLATVSPTSSRRVTASIAPQLRLVARVGYRQMAIHHEPALDELLNSLQAYLLANAAALRRGSQTDYDWAAHNLVVARQLRDYLRLQPAPEGTSTTIGPMDYVLDNVREKAMAANTLWALGEEGPRGRLMVFAHDAHVMSARSRGGMWSVYKEPPVMMGEHLRARLGKRLLIIGALAAHNGPGLPADRPLPASMEAALERLDVPLFALDLRPARRNAGAGDWLDERRPIRANFDSQLHVAPARAFDVIVFMNEIGPAKPNSALH